MQTFFNSIQSIDRFSLSLDSRLDDITCRHCHQSQAWMSHGFVYKQRSIVLREAVGKRLFCSNRQGKPGCGRTIQLYLDGEIPSRHYGTTQLFWFVTALLAGLSVCSAYQRIASLSSARQGWRWLSTLMNRLSTFRCHLPSRNHAPDSFTTRSRRLRLLLPTLQRLFGAGTLCGCAAYQAQQQRPFF